MDKMAKMTRYKNGVVIKMKNRRILVRENSEKNGVEVIFRRLTEPDDESVSALSWKIHKRIRGTVISISDEAMYNLIGAFLEFKGKEGFQMQKVDEL